MTYLDLIKEIRGLGFPCTYHSYDSPPSIPFTVVLYRGNDDLYADDHNYSEVGIYRLELYHEIKHPPSEMLIENKLRELRLPFRKSETRIESERLFLIAYEIRLLGGYKDVKQS